MNVDDDEDDDWLLDELVAVPDGASGFGDLVVPGSPVNEAVFQFENRDFSADRPVPFCGFDDEGRELIENLDELRTVGYIGSPDVCDIMAWLHPSREPPRSSEFVRRVLELRGGC